MPVRPDGAPVGTVMRLAALLLLGCLAAARAQAPPASAPPPAMAPLPSWAKLADLGLANVTAGSSNLLDSVLQQGGEMLQVQASALLSFKNGLSNAADILSSWTNNTANPCVGWVGVKCDSKGNVISLSLANKGLAGPLSASLGNLSGLTVMDLTGNALSGGIPSDWSANNALPALTALALSNNKLTTMPAALGGGGMRALKTVGLEANLLSGSIPQWSTQATITILPQAISSNMCGAVPSGGPTLFFVDGLGASWPLVNSLGSCTATCGSPKTVALGGGVNIYGAAVQNNATVWDTAAANLDAVAAAVAGTPASVGIPCYASGSPAGANGMPYLGGNMAFGMMAWGDANAGQVVSADGSAACAFTGTSWTVDLHVSLQLARVVVAAGRSGISGISISVGNDLTSLGACATGVSVNPDGVLAVACSGTGRYLSLAGGSMTLCSVQAFPEVADVALGKPFYYSTGGGAAAGNVTAGPQAVTARANGGGAGALFVLDLGYASAPVSGGTLVDATGVSGVALSSSNPLASSGGAGQRLRRALRQAPSSSSCTLGLGGQFACSGSGRYLVVSNSSANGSLSLGGLSVFTSGAPGATAAPLPAGAPVPAGAAGALRTTWIQTLLVGSGMADPATVESGANQAKMANSSASMLANMGYPGDGSQPNLLVNTTLQVDPSLTNDDLYTILNADSTRSAVKKGLSVFQYPDVWEASYTPVGASSGLGTGGIVGIAVGCAAGVLALAALAFWACSRRRRPRRGSSSSSSSSKSEARPSLPPTWTDLQTPGGGGGGQQGAQFISAGAAPSNALASAQQLYKDSPLKTGASKRQPGSAGGSIGIAPAATGSETPSAAQLLDSGGSSYMAKVYSDDPLLRWIIRSQGSSSAGSGGDRTPGSARSKGTADAGGGGRPRSAARLAEMRDWNMNFADLEIQKQIGEGSFGRVYLAKWNETLVAVKILLAASVDLGNAGDAERALSLSNPIMLSLEKEASMMATLRHPNTVQFLGVCLHPPSVATEYCARGSLTDVLRGAKNKAAMAAMLDWPRRLNMALDAAKGMLYLHAHASANLLVDKHWRVKVSGELATHLPWRTEELAVPPPPPSPAPARPPRRERADAPSRWRAAARRRRGRPSPGVAARAGSSPSPPPASQARRFRRPSSPPDFNLSKLMEADTVMSSMAATNPRWLAPEILAGHAATFASDVYAFAVVLWELLTWELPWGTTNPWQVVTLVTEGGRLEIPARASLPGPDTQTFSQLDAYVGLNPESRPGFQEVITELREMLSQTLSQRSSTGRAGAGAGVASRSAEVSAASRSGGGGGGSTGSAGATPAETPHAGDGSPAAGPPQPNPLLLDASLVERRMAGGGGIGRFKSSGASKQ
eukprot:scaffold12.g8111.t1